ncbi:MAG: PAS domain S-box protein, partial [Steroidobacteraceae bacterium]
MSDTSVVKRVNEPSPAQLRALIEQAPDGILVADPDGRCSFVNEAACRLLGFARDEIIGRHFSELIPPEDVDRLLDTKAQLLKGGSQVGEWQLRRKDGTCLHVEVSTRILADGQWQGIVRDISERKAHERERETLFNQVETERRWLQAVLDALPLGVVLYHRDGKTLYNRRTEDLMGTQLSPTDGSAQQSSRVLSPDGRPVSLGELISTRVLRDEETIASEEFLIERRDGSRIPILGSAAPIRDDNDRVIGGIGVLQDLSERMRAEEIVRDKQRLLQSIFDILPVGVWLADATGHLVSHNPAGERIWGGARYVPIAEFGQ